MKNKIFFNLQYIFLCLLSCTIPLSKPATYINVTPFLLGLLFLTWFIEGQFRLKFKRMKTHKTGFVLLTGLYLLYVIGLLYSKNDAFGWTDLFLKLPLLFFPLIIFTMDVSFWTKNKIHLILKFFVAGSFVLLLISLAYSIRLFSVTSSFHSFHYDSATFFHHTSYTSMYYCFATLIIIYFFLTQKVWLWEKIIAWIALILFSAEIAMLDSRAGILAFGCALVTYSCYLFFVRRPCFFRGNLYLFCAAFVFACVYLLLPKEINRMQTTVDKIIKETPVTNIENVNPRILIWDATLTIAIENLPFGVGTGDIKDELSRQYQKMNYQELHENNYNAHCQYLQIFATLGILGILVFLILIILPIWIGFKTRNILFLIFGVIIGIHFLVESMLEKQVGVMFFSFFFVFLCFVSQNQLVKEEKPVRQVPSGLV